MFQSSGDAPRALPSEAGGHPSNARPASPIRAERESCHGSYQLPESFGMQVATVRFFHKPDKWQEPKSNFNSKLNDLGAEGWELVTANEHIDDRGISLATTLYFKRQMGEKSLK